MSTCSDVARSLQRMPSRPLNVVHVSVPDCAAIRYRHTVEIPLPPNAGRVTQRPASLSRKPSSRTCRHNAYTVVAEEGSPVEHRERLTRPSALLGFYEPRIRCSSRRSVRTRTPPSHLRLCVLLQRGVYVSGWATSWVEAFPAGDKLSDGRGEDQSRRGVATPAATLQQGGRFVLGET
jgi:hypothetical protein